MYAQQEVTRNLVLSERQAALPPGPGCKHVSFRLQAAGTGQVLNASGLSFLRLRNRNGCYACPGGHIQTRALEQRLVRGSTWYYHPWSLLLLVTFEVVVRTVTS